MTTAASIQDQFEEFDRANPWVRDALVTMTRDLVAKGHKRVGMKMLFEVLRWQHAMGTVDANSDFKLNNNYGSRYARAIAVDCPDLAGVYETRILKAA